MQNYCQQNKRAWEFNAYDFWLNHSGKPEDRAKKDLEDPFPDEIRKQMPLCSYRKYTISEIINSVICNGFVLKRFDEHPAWKNANIPGEFTLVARRSMDR